MKKVILLLIVTTLNSCSIEVKEKLHKYIVISNDFKDTCMIEANSFRTRPIEIENGFLKRKHYGTITIFFSDKGDSQVYNVDKIISQ